MTGLLVASAFVYAVAYVKAAGAERATVGDVLTHLIVFFIIAAFVQGLGMTV